MKRLVLVGLCLALWVRLPLDGCELCKNSVRNQDTLSEEMERAGVVLYGRTVSSELDSRPGAALGAGRTNYRIDRILKDHPALINKNALVLERWLPVPDPKDPPRLMLYCMVRKDNRLDAYLGRPVRSEAAIGYLQEARKARKQGRITALRYYFDFLDHPDDILAADALLEFARADDKEVGDVRQFLKPEKIRALMKNPRTKAEFMGLLAFLLGGCGDQRDADYLLGLINRDDAASRHACDGLLAGYVSLKPREGWELLRTRLADTKRPIVPDRFAAVTAMRFSYLLKTGDFRQGALRCLATMLPDGDGADIAIEDLRKWQLWELTTTVLAQFGKETHQAPITRDAIIRYALCCPQPEARQFIDRIRPREQEHIRRIQEGIQFEKQ